MKNITLSMNPDNKIATIAPEIYGHFSEHLGACIYDGIYVGEDSDIPNTRGIRNDVIQALKAINVPVLRWPGGCFADEYHWRDGIGPQESRPKRINSNWGGVTESNAFGTHEFLDLCDLVGCEPYIAINLASGTVQEAADWVEYLTSDVDTDITRLRKENGREKPWKIKYIGIGNENWGGGGNMRPEYYADEYRRYQTFCKEYSGNKLYKVACGPNADDYNWTEGLLKNINRWHANGISLHYYTVPGDWEHKGSSTDFTQEEFDITIKKAKHLATLIDKHLAIMDQYDPEHHIDLLVDEWGTWFDVEPGTNPGFLYQQNTMRDAIVAALSLNIFNKRCERISMANIAQVVNVLQAMILTKDEKMVLTPSYQVFQMYKGHQNASLIASSLSQTEDIISESVSTKKDTILATICNTSSTEDVCLTLELEGKTLNNVQIKLLQGAMTAHNTFDAPDKVAIEDGIALYDGDTSKVKVPAGSIIAIEGILS